MNLTDAVAAIQQFHRHIQAPVARRPQLLEANRRHAELVAEHLRKLRELVHGLAADNPLLARLGMALEEMAEWLEAHVQEDLVAAADAWADRIYVLLGDAVAAGLPAAPLFEEVHRSNMSKDPSRSVQGKGIKSHLYQAPQIGCILKDVSRQQSLRDDLATRVRGARA